MIEIQRSQSNNISAYTLSFHRNIFLFAERVNFNSLNYFSTTSQEKLGKISIKFNIKHIQYIQKKQQIHYLILSHYQDILIAPYIVRQHPNIKIITTKLSYQLSYIYAWQFYHYIKEKNSTVTKLNMEYFKESEIIDQYQRYYQQDFSQWVQIFSRKQLQNCLQKCVKINYGQIYDTQNGITITPRPSGYTLGSSLWVFRHVMTKQSLLFGSNLAFHKWRVCQSCWLPKSKQQSDIKYLILTGKSIEIIQNWIPDDLVSLKFLQNVSKNLDRNKNCKIILNDQLIILDFILELNWKMNNKYKQIFIRNQSFQKMVMYANSYVEYLSNAYKNTIYLDPPEYSFQSYNVLKDKGFLWTGTLQSIADQQKIPFKQLLLRSKPYIHFIPNYIGILESEQDIIIQTHTPGLTNEDLQNFIKAFPKCSVYSFSEIKYRQYTKLQNNNKYIIGKPTNIYLQQRNSINGMIYKHKILNGQVYGELINRQFIKIDKQWNSILVKKLLQLGLMFNNINNQELSSMNTIIKLIDYQLTIESNSLQQLLVIENVLTSIIKKVKLH